MAELQANPDAQAAPQTQEVGRVGGDPMKMHSLALQAEKALEGLATEMGKANAPEPVVKAVGQMADAMRKILTSMAKAPAPQQERAQAPAAQPEQRPTIASATNDLAAQARQ